MLAESEIVSAAREAGFRIITNEETVTLMRVARAVEAAAYERAAQECEKRAGPIETYNRAYPHYLECAAAIRAFAAKQPEPTEAQIEARDALLDFIAENGTASEGVQHYLDRYVRAALAAKDK